MPARPAVCGPASGSAACARAAACATRAWACSRRCCGRRKQREPREPGWATCSGNPVACATRAPRRRSQRPQRRCSARGARHASPRASRARQAPQSAGTPSLDWPRSRRLRLQALAQLVASACHQRLACLHASCTASRVSVSRVGNLSRPRVTVNSRPRVTAAHRRPSRMAIPMSRRGRHRRPSGHGRHLLAPDAPRVATRQSAGCAALPSPPATSETRLLLEGDSPSGISIVLQSRLTRHRAVTARLYSPCPNLPPPAACLFAIGTWRIGCPDRRRCEY